jgi:hypothetical protein
VNLLRPWPWDRPKAVLIVARKRTLRFAWTPCIYSPTHVAK